MVAESTVPQLVDKKGGSYSAIAPRLEAKPYDSLSQTYTHYKTLLNELSNDGVTLSKREINVVFMNSLPKRSVYKDNLIQRRYLGNKKALITTPISTAFFSINIVQDFQENSDDEADERTMSNISSVSKGFQPNFTPKLIQSSQPAKSSQNKPKIQKDYKAEYKKMKAKLALLEAIPSTSHSPKTFQSKNKGLVAETFDWDEEEVSDDEEMPQVKVLMALADDELLVGKNHACNGEWIDITMRKCRDDLLALKQAKLDVVTFQIQNNELTKLNYALQEQLKEERRVTEKWLNSSKKVTSLDYDHEMIPKSKDWVKRHNLDNKLLNFNTGRILVPKSQVVNECLKLTKAYNDPESSKDSGSESLTLLPPLKNLQRASPSSKESKSDIPQSKSSMSGDSSKVSQESKPKVQNTNSSKILYCMKCKREDHRTSDHNMYVASLKSSENYKARPYKYASPSKQILKAKEKPFPPCTHYRFNDHRPDDYQNYPECEICGSYDHFTSRHNRVILVRG
ncbi:hypothetical protein Tco_1116913 [Tanacetum coccineum]